MLERKKSAALSPINRVARDIKAPNDKSVRYMMWQPTLFHFFNWQPYQESCRLSAICIILLLCVPRSYRGIFWTHLRRFDVRDSSQLAATSSLTVLWCARPVEATSSLYRPWLNNRRANMSHKVALRLGFSTRQQEDASTSHALAFLWQMRGERLRRFYERLCFDT